MAENHQGIVYGVLKRLNIRPDNSQFEDLKQEGFIHLAKKYSLYDGDVKDDKICAYLFQGVYWYLLDLLRKQQRNDNKMIDVSKDNDQWTAEIEDPKSLHDELDNIEIMNQLWLHCTGNQRRFLCCTYNDAMTVTQIARKYGVSRKTVYQWKKGVQKEFYKLGLHF